MADLGEAEHATIQHDAVAILGKGERVVAGAALEAGIPWYLAMLRPPEEGLIGPLYPQEHILQHLGMHSGVFRAGRFRVGQFRLLLAIGSGSALSLLPPGLALLPGAVVERATAQQDRLPRLLLLRSGFQRVLVGLACALVFHSAPCCLIGENPAPTGTYRYLRALAGHPAFSPLPEGRGLKAGYFANICVLWAGTR